MIAIWMLYAIVISVAIAICAAVAEPLVRNVARPARLVWSAALLTSLVAAGLALVMAHQPVVSRTAPTGKATAARAAQAIPAVAPRTDEGAAPVTPQGDRSLRRLAASLPSLAWTVRAGAVPVWLDKLLLAVWLASSLLVLAVLAGSMRHLRRVGGLWVQDEVDGTPVLVSHDIGPALLGFVSYRIVLPRWVLGLTPAARMLILRHEREHARAADPLLVLLGAACPLLMPWNPAAWYMLHRLRLAVEIDCDKRVLEAHPDAREYCTLLIDVTERGIPQAAPIAALAEPISLLKARISAMAAVRRVARTESVLRIAGIALLLSVVAAMPSPRAALDTPARLATLTTELQSLLEDSTVVASLSELDRVQLLRELDWRLTVSAQPMMKPTDLEIDGFVDSLYPTVRGDTIPTVIGLLLDRRVRIIGHAVRPVGDHQLSAPASLYWMFPEHQDVRPVWTGLQQLSRADKRRPPHTVLWSILPDSVR